MRRQSKVVGRCGGDDECDSTMDSKDFFLKVASWILFNVLLPHLSNRSACFALKRP